MGGESTASILIVDDDPILIRVLGRMLEPIGCVRFAMSGEDALKLMRMAVPDVVLLDAEMPGISGVRLCRMLKQDPAFSDVPVVFFTSNCEPAFEAACFELGAVDYVQKPVRAPVLQARLLTHIRWKQLSDRLRRHASVDPLTEIANRRIFDETLAHEWGRALRNNAPLSLLLVDIDYFKAYNDNYGHPQGDECLRAFASSLRRIAVRTTDLVARYGGEEFAILLPDTAEAGARAVASRLIAYLQEVQIPHAYSDVADHLTASVGASTYQPRGMPTGRRAEPPRPLHASSADLVSYADRALYEAKRSGRRRASFHPCDDATRISTPRRLVMPNDPARS